jgi:hypothetical protein
MSSGSLTDSSGQITLGSTNLSTTGQVQASTFVSPSDQRLKHDIENAQIEGADYSELYTLQPRSFKWPDGRQDIGLIAQEVQETLDGYPELASLVSPINDNSSVYLGVDYSKLSVLTLMMARNQDSRLSEYDAQTPDDYKLPMWQAFKKLYQHVDDLQGVIAVLARQIPFSDAPPPRGFSIVTASADLPPGTTGINGLSPWD